MDDFARPVWILDGKQYKTVDGLFKAVMRKHRAAGATGMSSIGADRILSVHKGRDEVLTRYRCSPPTIGKPMILTQEPR